MSKRTRIFALTGLLAIAALLVGCEWETTSDGGSWNSDYNWVNFSGVYRGANGGILVTDYSTAASGGSGSPGSPGSTNSVNGDVIGQGDGFNTTFFGILSRKPIVAGSVSISAGGFSLSDNSNGSLVGNSGSSGSIDYGTGAWSIDLQGTPLGSGTPIYGSYNYTIPGTPATEAEVPTGPGSGASKVAIYSFVVHQEGNTISITDNNGSVYSGNFGSLRSTGGAGSSTTNNLPGIGDQVVGQFEATGVSGAGYNVKMIGTFQGVVGYGSAGAGGSSMYLADRRMLGTWIETAGRTGNVSGQSAPIAVSQ